jgi:hypothetical protein
MHFGKASGGSTDVTAFVDAQHPYGVAQRVGTIEDRILIAFCTGVRAAILATLGVPAAVPRERSAAIRSGSQRESRGGRLNWPIV